MKVARLAVVALLAVGLLPLAAGAAERISVGDPVREFALSGVDGETRSPATLAAESKLVLVFFRGTW